MTEETEGKRPLRWPRRDDFEPDLELLGVKVIGREPLRYQCAKCGASWSPHPLRGGRLPRAYWRCPKGCNNDVRV